MYQFEHMVKGDIDLKKAWIFYSDVSQWNKWDSDIENVILQGEFTEGSIGVMNMKNGQSLPFVLDSVISESEFVTSSHLGPVTVSFGHIITAKTMLHTVTMIGGEEKQLEEMGKGLTAHIPANMETLLSLSQK